MSKMVFGYLILISIDYYNYFSVVSLVLVLIDKIFLKFNNNPSTFSKQRKSRQ